RRSSDLARFGLEAEHNEQYAQIITKAYQDFWHDIAFTFTSFATQFDQPAIERILLLGSGSEIKGLPAFISKMSDAPCERFSVHELLQSKQVQLTNKQCGSSTYIMSLSIAWPTSITLDSNLRQKEFRLAKESNLFIKQLSVMGIL